MPASSEPVLITRHPLRSQRSIVVHPCDARGDADLGSVAHALNQVEVQGARTHLISNDCLRDSFEVAVVHPVGGPLPRWAKWLGASRGAPVLVWAADVPSTKSPAWGGVVRPHHLALLGLTMLALAGLAWWHATPTDDVGDMVFSRYGLTAVVLLGLLGWRDVVTHLARLSVDLSAVHPLFQYPLHPTPGRFDTANHVQINIGDTLLRIVRGEVSEVTHWLHPGVAYPGAQPEPQLRFRFYMNGRRFEGRTAHQAPCSHPFIVAGDELRVAVQPTGDGGWRVVALANLSDGHLMFDETDERLKLISGASRHAISLLGMGTAALVAIWLSVGPQGDDITKVLLTTCLSLGGWIGVTMAWKRRRRAQLAVALGTRLQEQRQRRVVMTPVNVW